MKKIREMLFSSEYTLEERLLFLGGLFGALSISVVLAINIMQRQSPIVIGALVLGTLVMFGVVYVGARFRRLHTVGMVIILIIGGIFYPISYLMGGGLHSGSPVWFVAIMMFVFMLYTGGRFWFLLILMTIIYAVTTYLGFTHPEWIIDLPGENAIYHDIFASSLAVGVLAGILLKYQNTVLRRETEVSEAQKEEIEKLNDAQNRFFSSMSHEIRTPINTIIGLNEMTLREKQLPAEVTENAVNIQNASKMLLSLINDILDLSKIQSGRMEVVETQYESGAMLSEIVNLLWNRAKEKGLRFEINVGEAIPQTMHGDEMRIKQIIINLLTNAIKYTEEGAVTLNIDGERTMEDEFILRIDVEDTGSGIRKENIPYLFDSFKRVDERDNRHIEGTGLGLSISKQLVELMGGKIYVDSIYTVGSTFHVEIPQRIVNAEPLSFRNVTDTTRAISEYEQIFEAPDAHVLIVDDNDMNRMVCKKLLRATKVQVDMAASGRECLEMTEKMHYDVIFMDHEMPEMDGVVALQKVRAQEGGLCRNTPVIALTANAGSDMQEFYLEHGFHAYLAKPIHSEVLESTLLQLLPSELIEKQVNITSGESFTVSQSRKKRPLLITADCGCDLPKELVEEYNIWLMPQYVITEEGRFRDVEEIDADNIAEYMMRNGGNVRTEPSTVEEYERFFGKALADAENVLHISLMPSVSKSYDNAVEAAGSFGNVHVFDSANMTSGLGFVVLRAAEMAMRGEKLDSILAELELYKEDVITTFIIPSSRSVMMNRAIPRALKYFITAINFDPVFQIKHGSMRLNALYFGYINNTTKQYIRKQLRNEKNIDKRRLIIAYCGCSLEKRKEVYEEVKKYGHFDEIISQKASATVSANGGVDAFGLIYAKKRAD